MVSNRAEPDDYGWVFWPQHGEFANQTNFITQDNALEVLEFELEDRCVDEIAIFTDGIERLVLDLTREDSTRSILPNSVRLVNQNGGRGSR